MMRRLYALIAALSVSGCASMSPTEYAWQGLNVVDGMQTYYMAQNPECWHERDPLTRTLIGEHPSTGEVIAVTVGYAVGHWYVSRWLEEKTDEAWATNSPNRGTWSIAKFIWTWGLLGGKSYAVWHNYEIGLGPINRETCEP